MGQQVKTTRFDVIIHNWMFAQAKACHQKHVTPTRNNEFNMQSVYDFYLHSCAQWVASTMGHSLCPIPIPLDTLLAVNIN